MASVNAEVVLTTARTLLNDDATSLWTDAVLFPKLAQAHRELQAKLKADGALVMRASTAIAGDIVVGAGVLTLTLPADMQEPIRLFEIPTGGLSTAFAPMTETDPLPTIAQAANLRFWQWYQEQIYFVGATASNTVRMIYWRQIPVPMANTDLIGFTNGELYLAPRVAALAAGSVGNSDVMTYASQLADSSYATVVVANKGRMKIAPGSAPRN